MSHSFLEVLACLVFSRMLEKCHIVKHSKCLTSVAKMQPLAAFDMCLINRALYEGNSSIPV